MLDGGVPYRDAWDQKPPRDSLHLRGAVALWPTRVGRRPRRPAARGGTRLAAAVCSAGGHWRAARRLGGGRAAVSALGNPGAGRLGGVRVRGQCEVFIALAVAARSLLLARAARRTPQPIWRSAGSAACGSASRSGSSSTPSSTSLPAHRVWSLGRAQRVARPGVADPIVARRWFVVDRQAVACVLRAQARSRTSSSRRSTTTSATRGGDVRPGRWHFVDIWLPFPSRQRGDLLWFLGGARRAALLLVAAAAARGSSLVCSAGSRRRACRSRSTAPRTCRSISFRRRRRWRCAAAVGGAWVVHRACRRAGCAIGRAFVAGTLARRRQSESESGSARCRSSTTRFDVDYGGGCRATTTWPGSRAARGSTSALAMSTTR